MLEQALDYREECDSLYELLSGLGDADWNRVTQFKGWTFNDVVGHLNMFDLAAAWTVQDPPAFRQLLAGVNDALARGVSMRDYTRSWLGDCRGAVLLRSWRATSLELAGLYADLDPKRRVAWAGPEMSVRSSISARQMETWAHGQALFDALGRTRTEQDRIRNIVVMGVNTFAWTFVNRGLPVPGIKPHLRLRSPGGETWTWNEPDQDNLIEGSAVDFGRVVTQTRNVSDTALTVRGGAARAWMSMAQCFAGAPETPPEPGTRFQVVSPR